MVRILWSLKGGQGVTATTALLALHHQFQHDPVVIIDCVGDIAAVFDVPVQSQIGLADWFASHSDQDALDQLVQPLLPQIGLLTGGSSGGPSTTALLDDRWELFENWLNDFHGVVLIDVGSMPIWTDRLNNVWAPLIKWLMQHYHASLVSRLEYLSLRRYFAYDSNADSLILVQSSNDLLRPEQVVELCDRPVHAQVQVDRDVATAIETASFGSLSMQQVLNIVEFAT